MSVEQFLLTTAGTAITAQSLAGEKMLSAEFSRLFAVIAVLKKEISHV